MNQKRNTAQETVRPPRGLGLGLAGVMGFMSLFMFMSRAAPESILTPRVPVATGEESPTARHPSIWPEPRPANPAGVDQAIRQRSESESDQIARWLRRRRMFIASAPEPPVQLRQERHVTPDGVGLQERDDPNYKHLVPSGTVNTASDQSGTEGVQLNVQQPRATTYRYDDLNRLIEVIYADGTRITYTYDAAGNLTQTVTRPR
jgi:YD repeat-containing protein